MTWLQIAVNALVAASTIALVGASFQLIYRVAGFFHFALAAMFTIGAYGYYFFAQSLGWPISLSALLGIAISGSMGIALDSLTFARLRRHGASHEVMLLASIGLYVVLENGLVALFGDETKVSRVSMQSVWPTTTGIVITRIQVLGVLLGLVLLPLATRAMSSWKLGKTWGAVSNDRELAAVYGINVAGAIRSAFWIGSMFAGLAGILYGIDLDFSPRMGMTALMLGMVAALIGGASSLTAVVWGAILLSSIRNLVTWKLGAEWQDAIAFGILVIALFVKPRNLRGHGLKRSFG